MKHCKCCPNSIFKNFYSWIMKIFIKEEVKAPKKPLKKKTKKKIKAVKKK